MSKAQTLIADLVSNLGLAEVQFDDSGSCGLLFDNETNVTLETDPATAHLLHLHSSIATVPHEGRHRFYHRLLLGNYLGHHTQGAALALDSDGHSVLLRLTLDASRMDVGKLAERLTTFVATARQWRERLEGLETVSSPVPSTTDGIDPFTTSFIRI